MRRLERISLDRKDRRIIKELYWKQTAAVKVDRELSQFQEIKRGVRPGCAFSQDLFSQYREKNTRQLEERKGNEV